MVINVYVMLFSALEPLVFFSDESITEYRSFQLLYKQLLCSSLMNETHLVWPDRSIPFLVEFFLSSVGFPFTLLLRVYWVHNKMVLKG